MTEPKWRKTTIQELNNRVARGEWPRFRALGSGDSVHVQGRLLGDGRRQTPHGPRWSMINELEHLGIPSGSPESVDLTAYADLEIWTVDKSVNMGPHEPRHPAEAAMLASKLTAERSSHRAYTLTDRTLQLARDTARAASGAGGQGDARKLADELTRALEHAQGMPEADLRRLATWVRERCSDYELGQIADATLAHLALDAMPVGSVEVRDDLPSGWQWAKEKIASAWDYAHAARSHDYAEGMKALRQRAETYERERDLARARVADLDARVVGLERALDKATEAAQNWKSRLSWEKINAERTENTRPAAYVDCLVLALLRIEAILSGVDPGTVAAPATAIPLHRAQSIVERATEARAETCYLRNELCGWQADLISLSLSLRRIEAISNGQPPSSISDAGEIWPAEAADALVSRLLSQFVEFGKVSDALAKVKDSSMVTIEQLDSSRARITQLERELEAAAKDRALVTATETLVRRMVDRLVETDPEWIESLRKGGS